MTRIRQLREALGKDQKVLAIDLSVTQPTISDWENGRKKPSIENCERLANYFNVSIDYLICRTDIPTHKFCSADLFGFPFFDAIKDCCTRYNVDFTLISDYFLDENRSASLQFVIRELGLKLNDKLFIENLFHGKPLDDVLASCDYEAQKILPLAMNRREVQLVQFYRQLNEEGQEKLLDASDDLVQSGKYKKHHSAFVDKSV